MVVEEKSFSKAGSMIYLSQPTVSSHVKDLENHFECKLIDRLGRQVAPTKAGELLYQYGTRILALVEETDRALAEFHGKMKGHLTIGGSTIPGGYILPPMLGLFKRTYPDITITLTENDTAGIVEDTINGRIEVGIVGAKPSEPRLECEKLMTDEMVLVVPPNHPLSERQRTNLKQLMQTPFIMREPGSGTRKSIEQVLEKKGVKLSDLNVVAEMGSTEAVRQAVKAGVGVSILSKRAVSDELNNGILAKVGLSSVSFKRAFYLILHKHRTRSPLCHVFLQFLKEQCAEKRQKQKRSR
jgi:DNA-binding transcriptional LysR family regulator